MYFIFNKKLKIKLTIILLINEDIFINCLKFVIIIEKIQLFIIFTLLYLPDKKEMQNYYILQHTIVIAWNTCEIVFFNS